MPAAVRRLNRGELVAETLRCAVEGLATRSEDWLAALVTADWADRYGRPVRHDRLPRGQDALIAWLLQAGDDGIHVLRAVCQDDAPPGLREFEVRAGAAAGLGPTVLARRIGPTPMAGSEIDPRPGQPQDDRPAEHRQVLSGRPTGSRFGTACCCAGWGSWHAGGPGEPLRRRPDIPYAVLPGARAGSAWARTAVRRASATRSTWLMVSSACMGMARWRSKRSAETGHACFDSKTG